MNATLQRILARFGLAPAPSPAPAMKPPVVQPPDEPPLIVGPIIDTSGWLPETPGWSREGTRITFAGPGGSTLRSPRFEVPASRTLEIAVGMACEIPGDWTAKGRAYINVYNARGGSVAGNGGTELKARGNGHFATEFPDSATHYDILLYAVTSYEGGTNDTRLLPCHFVNLNASCVPA